MKYVPFNSYLCKENLKNLIALKSERWSVLFIWMTKGFSLPLGKVIVIWYFRFKFNFVFLIKTLQTLASFAKWWINSPELLAKAPSPLTETLNSCCRKQRCFVFESKKWNNLSAKDFFFKSLLNRVVRR